MFVRELDTFLFIFLIENIILEHHIEFFEIFFKRYTDTYTKYEKLKMNAERRKKQGWDLFWWLFELINENLSLWHLKRYKEKKYIHVQVIDKTEAKISIITYITIPILL